MTKLSLKEITYYKTGGTCHSLYAPHTVEELSSLMSKLYHDQTPYFLLGAGSNSLVMDDPWSGAVITFQNLRNLSHDGSLILVEAGVENTRLAQYAFSLSLDGLGWLNELPGQIGASLYMNARCYHGNFKQYCHHVTTITRDGSIKEYQKEAPFIGYKKTIFQQEDEIVVEASFHLPAGDHASIEKTMNFCRDDRLAKKQFLYPSCGCVFKNDYVAQIPSGRLLDHAKVRSLSTDKVMISPYHANFVFNKGATSREILDVTLKMRERVYQVFGIWLEYEMKILGTIPDDLKELINTTRQSTYDQKELAPLREQFIKDTTKEL